MVGARKAQPARQEVSAGGRWIAWGGCNESDEHVASLLAITAACGIRARPLRPLPVRSLNLDRRFKKKETCDDNHITQSPIHVEKETLLRALDLFALRDSIAAPKSARERATLRVALLQLRLPAHRRLRYHRQSGHSWKRRTLMPKLSTLPGRLPCISRKSYHRSARRDLPANNFFGDDVHQGEAFLTAIAPRFFDLAEWRNGRRTGFKILWGVTPVRVRVPPRLSCSFL